MPVFPAIFERVAGNLLSVDGSATQLPAILLAILLGVDAPLGASTSSNIASNIAGNSFHLTSGVQGGDIAGN